MTRGPFAGHFSSTGIRNRVAFQWRALLVPGQPRRNGSPIGRGEMHREDLMNPDLLSEIVLLGSSAVIFVSLLLLVATVLTRV